MTTRRGRASTGHHPLRATHLGRLPALGRERQGGQAMVEFALALLPLVLLIFAIVDLGRGVYTYTASAQAAREIARAASLHPYGSSALLGGSAEALAAIQAHSGCTAWPADTGCGTGQVPALRASGLTIACVDIRDQAVSGVCRPGSFVRVSIAVAFDLSTPLLGQLGPFRFTSASHARLS